MQFKASIAALLLQTLGASATWLAYEEYLSLLPKRVPLKHESIRPKIEFWPKHPTKPFPTSPPRNRVCYVKSHNDFKTDDSEYILEAIDSCNNGGHVVFPQGTTYVIGTALNLTDLKHIDLDIQAYIQFTNDTTYWQEAAFYQTFQNATTFFQIGGEDVNIYGGGMLDGNGQVWYNLYAINDLILRPILNGIIGLNIGTYSDIYLRYSPEYYYFVANSTNVVFQDINIGGYSLQSNVTASNTDGWDTYRSSDITIQNSIINNGDDCVSFKPNSTNMLVQNLKCNGSHGISVGSLGQYEGEVDIVENVYVYNISMANAENGARIKVWPGEPSELSADLQGGGGTGYVKNITYDTMKIINVDYAIDITQCYGQDNLTLCNEYPSNVTISDVSISNVYGTTSTAYEPISGYVVCSSPSVCTNITLTDIVVVSPDGAENEFDCGEVDETLLYGINCTSATST